MAIVLYHHPHSRAATVVWMLEEVGVEYTIEHVDIRAGSQKQPEFLALNPMGKLPTLVDDGVVVTETAAIGLYLADRYAQGRLAPALDAAERGTYLRWILYAPSVIEPCAAAHAANWDYTPGSVGWGTWESMLETAEHAIGDGPWILGDQFSMADVVFGATLRFMLMFGMLEKRERFTDYVARLEERPAMKAATARNQAILEALGA